MGKLNKKINLKLEVKIDEAFIPDEVGLRRAIITLMEWTMKNVPHMTHDCCQMIDDVEIEEIIVL